MSDKQANLSAFELNFDRMGCSCKLQASRLRDLLNQSGLEHLFSSRQVVSTSPQLAILQTVDFFTPVSCDPQQQGSISAANVLNDVYSMGITDVLGFSVILALKPTTPIEVAVRVIRGIKKTCEDVGTAVIGGHTINTCEVLVGGCAIATADPRRIVYPNGAKAGDVLVLTKPLGLQLVMMASYMEKRGLLEKGHISSQTKRRASHLMSHPANKIAQGIQSFGANASIDITGFGLCESALQMAKLSHVDLNFDCIPLLKESVGLSGLIGKELKKGESPETAGGILISLTKEQALNMRNEMRKAREFFFVVGKVTEKKGTIGRAVIPDDIEALEV